MGKKLEIFATGYFKTKGMVKGKVGYKYGANFSFKIEGYSNDEITKELALEIGKEIEDYADGIFSDYSLTRTKVRATYGTHFTINITAHPLVLGRNGVNLGSEDASTFRMMCQQWGLTPEDLGNEGVVGGVRYVLLGAQYKRGGVVIVARKWENGKIYLLKNESAISYFGGKVSENA
jgi:hypothetical protein